MFSSLGIALLLLVAKNGNYYELVLIFTYKI